MINERMRNLAGLVVNEAPDKIAKYDPMVALGIRSKNNFPQIMDRSAWRIFEKKIESSLSKIPGIKKAKVVAASDGVNPGKGMHEYIIIDIIPERGGAYAVSVLPYYHTGEWWIDADGVSGKVIKGLKGTPAVIKELVLIATRLGAKSATNEADSRNLNVAKEAKNIQNYLSDASASLSNISFYEKTEKNTIVARRLDAIDADIKKALAEFKKLARAY